MMNKEKMLFVQHGSRNAGKTKQMIQELRPDLDVYVYSGFTDEERDLIIKAIRLYWECNDTMVLGEDTLVDNILNKLGE